MVAEYTPTNSAKRGQRQQFNPERRQRPEGRKWRSLDQSLPPASSHQPTAMTSAKSGAAGVPTTRAIIPQTGASESLRWAALNTGDRLQVKMDPDRWEILDDGGLVVGQIARGFNDPLARPRPTPVFWTSSPGIRNVRSPLHQHTLSVQWALGHDCHQGSEKGPSIRK